MSDHEPVVELTDAIGRELRARGMTLGVAESCTGGMVAARLTDLPGASAFFRGAVVAYANDLKERLLGVTARTIESHGAVSREAAREMAAGACRGLDADVGIAITGIAGPEGGSAEKPVGTVWAAARIGDLAVERLFRFAGGRDEIRVRAVQGTLSLLLDLLQAPAEEEASP